MRGNNQRKFFIPVISSAALTSHGRALVCLQHSPSQFCSLRWSLIPGPLRGHNHLLPASMDFFFAFISKQLIFKPRQRRSSSPSKINRCQSSPSPGLIQSTLP